MSAAGNASGSRNSRIAMYCAVHSPIPGSALNFTIASSRLAPRLKIAGSAAMACASEVTAIARAPGMPSVVRSAARNPGNAGKQMAETLALLHRRRQRIAKGLHQFAEQFGRGRNRDLLAEDRAHREFETVPRPGDAQARPRRDQRRQRRIERKMRADRIGIGGEIEHPPHPRDDLRQGRHVGKANADVDPVLRRGRNADHAAFAPIAIVRR